MSLNLIALTAALSAFLGIWWGHVGVRVIERHSPRLWPAVLLTLLLGLALELWAATTDNKHIAVAAGIIGVTLLWDAFELVRQENRVKHGHAPANPDNPRHARILKAHSSATTLDLLDREPVGRRVNAEEAVRLVTTGEEAS
ncbi:MAG: DUF4491 family protein [Chloroflexi bacterium]|nr:DUF4491 family protein [Chloroflexota bacterium]